VRSLVLRRLKRDERDVAEGEAVHPESLFWVRLESLRTRSLRFWRVFRQSRLGMIGLIILLVFIVMALSAPLLTSAGILRDPNAVLCGQDFHVCPPTRPDEMDYAPPNGYVWLGTDFLGRDIFSRVWWGSQITILIGALASIFSMGVGTFIGLVSGYYGGWLDELLMRITDFFLVLPTLVFALILFGIVGSRGSIWTMIMIIGITFWASTARLVRSQVLTIKERQFIERARAIGASKTRIVRRHIFPNSFSLVFAEAILTVAVAILTEAFLSFLGFLDPNEVITWGTIIEAAYSYSAVEKHLIWWIVTPGLAIVAVVMGFTLLGFALDEIFNPRLRRR